MALTLPTEPLDNQARHAAGSAIIAGARAGRVGDRVRDQPADRIISACGSARPDAEERHFLGDGILAQRGGKGTRRKKRCEFHDLCPCYHNFLITLAQEEAVTTVRRSDKCPHQRVTCCVRQLRKWTSRTMRSGGRPNWRIAAASGNGGSQTASMTKPFARATTSACPTCHCAEFSAASTVLSNAVGPRNTSSATPFLQVRKVLQGGKQLTGRTMRRCLITTLEEFPLEAR